MKRLSTHRNILIDILPSFIVSLAFECGSLLIVIIFHFCESRRSRLLMALFIIFHNSIDPKDVTALMSNVSISLPFQFRWCSKDANHSDHFIVMLFVIICYVLPLPCLAFIWISILLKQNWIRLVISFHYFNVGRFNCSTLSHSIQPFIRIF